MLKPRRDQVVAWRGPMLDRALVQMLSDVYWGDLDVLLLDLPPGTGDVAISLGQHLPNAEVVVVTTPQEAAAEVAERAGTMASMMHQRVVGVVENMSYLPCPHCGPEHRLEVFGSGGGDRVAATLSERFGYDVPVLGRIPLDISLREGGDTGKPIVESDPDGRPPPELDPRRRGPVRPRPRPGRHAARPDSLGRGSDAMFGVGLPEMAVIAFVAVLVFGPDRLPDLAKQAGAVHQAGAEVSPTPPATTSATSSARSTPTSSCATSTPGRSCASTSWRRWRTTTMTSRCARACGRSATARSRRTTSRRPDAGGSRRPSRWRRRWCCSPWRGCSWSPGRVRPRRAASQHRAGRWLLARPGRRRPVSRRGTARR